VQSGLDTFHKQANPSRAAALFRQVLALNPDHDGATPQLARALDQGGKPEEALPGAMAESIEYYNQRRYHEGFGNVAPARGTRVEWLGCQDKVQFRQLATGLHADASKAATAQNHSASRPQKGFLVLQNRPPAVKLKRIRAEKGDSSLSGTPLSTVKGASAGEQAAAEQDEAAGLRRRGRSNERLRYPIR